MKYKHTLDKVCLNLVGNLKVQNLIDQLEEEYAYLSMNREQRDGKDVINPTWDKEKYGLE